MFPEGLPYGETGLGIQVTHSIYTHLTRDLVDEATLVAPQGFNNVENAADTWYFSDCTHIDTHTKKSIHPSISHALRRISWYPFGHGN
jgi:hypothetical protein